MEGKYKLLNEDNDVLSIERDTLRVGQLKEDLQQKMYSFAAEIDYGRRAITVDRYSRSISLMGTFERVTWINSHRSVTECELLMLGAKSWQKGKLEIELVLEVLSTLEEFKHIQAKNMDSELRSKGLKLSDVLNIQTTLKFFPEQSELKSELDDIRQSINENS